jgi:hypothetical protein
MTPLQFAKTFLGHKELAGNKFINDPKAAGDLGELLHQAGQRDGEAWCAYFMEAIFCTVLTDKEKVLRALFSASAKKTFENFQKAGYTVSNEPIIGALVIWTRYLNGIEQWQGHAGIVSEVISPTQFKSIEGNTNCGGSREGDSVQEKIRNTAMIRTGLNIKGFILI